MDANTHLRLLDRTMEAPPVSFPLLRASFLEHEMLVGGHSAERCSTYCIDVGGSRRHGVAGYRQWTGWWRYLASWWRSMASLTKCMQFFDLKMAWWIDGDDFFIVHHRGVR
jgi:hypothetical protein